MRTRRRPSRLTVLALATVMAAALAMVPPGTPSGADGNEATGAPLAFRSITAGGNHTCALLPPGHVKCWGSSAAGQLGLGDLNPRGDGPREMGADLLRVDLGTGRTAIAITAGQNHTCAVLDNGALKCWGDNSLGKLGLGNQVNRGSGPNQMGDNLPAVDLGAGRTAAAVTAGESHTCALLDNGAVKCWGLGGNGRLGLGDTATRGDQSGELGDNLPAVDLGSGRTATAVTAGESHTCAVLDNGAVKCWGYGGNGRLGLGDTATRGSGPNQMGDNLPAVDLGAGRTATAVTAGSSHTCALLDDDATKCWGENGDGQLGLGDITDRGGVAGDMGDSLPAVDLGVGRSVVAVTVGSGHSCAIIDTSALKCWGASPAGQLGQGTGTSRGDGPGEMGDNLPAVVLVGSGVTGTVSAISGPNIPGALLAVFHPIDFSIAATTVALSDGRFSVAVSPGQYYLYALDPTGVRSPGFYGAPALVVVVAGQLSTADPALPVPSGSIAGTVTETGSGAPIGGAWAVAIDSGTGSPEVGVTANGSGQFILSNLAPGTYYVAFFDRTGHHAARFHPAVPNLATATPVAVTAGGVSAADGSLPAQAAAPTGAMLTGRVTTAGSGAPIAGAYVLALRADDLSFGRGAVTNATGGYALNLNPAGYKLAFIDPAGRHAMEWHDDQPLDGLGGAATVTAPAITNAALDPLTGSMSGTVTNEAGAAVAQAWVVAVRSTGVAGASVTGGDGSYRIAGLAPDTYRATVIDTLGGVIEYWADAPGYGGAAVFLISAGDDTPVDAVVGPP